MIKRTAKEEKIYQEMLSHERRQRAWAIRAKCYECSAYQMSEIKKCPCTDCPLWKYRLGPNQTAKLK